MYEVFSQDIVGHPEVQLYICSFCRILSCIVTHLVRQSHLSWILPCRHNAREREKERIEN